MDIKGTCASKHLGETVRHQSERREEWIREIRRERLQGIVEGTSSVPRLASSLAALFPERNECSGTRCSLIEQEEREDSSCQICQVPAGKIEVKRKTGDRTGWRESNWREENKSGRLIGVA